MVMLVLMAVQMSMAVLMLFPTCQVRVVRF